MWTKGTTMWLNFLYWNIIKCFSYDFFFSFIWLPQYILIASMRFGQHDLSFKILGSHSTSFSILSEIMNLYSIMDLMIHIWFEDFMILLLSSIASLDYTFILKCLFPRYHLPIYALKEWDTKSITFGNITLGHKHKPSGNLLPSLLNISSKHPTRSDPSSGLNTQEGKDELVDVYGPEPEKPLPNP